MLINKFLIRSVAILLIPAILTADVGPWAGIARAPRAVNQTEGSLFGCEALSAVSGWFGERFDATSFLWPFGEMAMEAAGGFGFPMPGMAFARKDSSGDRASRRKTAQAARRAAEKQARPEPPKGSSTTKRTTRRAWLGAALLAAGGATWWYLTRHSKVPVWESREQMRSYVISQIDELITFARGAKRGEETLALEMLRENLSVQEMGLSMAAILAQTDDQGNFPLNPKYNKPAATLLFNIVLLQDLVGVDRPTADLYVQSLIWKEVGTLLPKWREPDSDVIRRKLVLDVLKPLQAIGTTDPSDSRVIALLANPDYRKKVKMATAHIGYHEASGYVAELKLLKDRGWTAARLDAAADAYQQKKLFAAGLQSSAQMMRIVDVDWSDALRLSALTHITEILLRAQSTIQPDETILMQDAIFRVALQVEAEEGHTTRVNGRAQIPPFDPRAIRFPSDYFQYLRDPAYYNPKLKDLDSLAVSPELPPVLAAAARAPGARVVPVLTSLNTKQHAFAANLVGFAGMAMLFGLLGLHHWLAPSLIGGGIWLLITGLLATVGRARAFNEWLAPYFGALFWEIWFFVRIFRHRFRSTRAERGDKIDRDLDDFVSGHYTAEELARLEWDVSLQKSYRKRTNAVNAMFIGLFLALVVGVVGSGVIMLDHYVHFTENLNNGVELLLTGQYAKFFEYDLSFTRWLIGEPILWLVGSHAFVNWILSRLPQSWRLHVPVLTRGAPAPRRSSGKPGSSRRIWVRGAGSVAGAGALRGTGFEPNVTPDSFARVQVDRAYRDRIVEWARTTILRLDRYRPANDTHSRPREENLLVAA